MFLTYHLPLQQEIWLAVHSRSNLIGVTYIYHSLTHSLTHWPVHNILDAPTKRYFFLQENNSIKITFSNLLGAGENLRQKKVNYSDKRDKFTILRSLLHCLTLSMTYAKSFVAVELARVPARRGLCNVVTRTPSHVDLTVAFNMADSIKYKRLQHNCWRVDLADSCRVKHTKRCFIVRFVKKINPAEYYEPGFTGPFVLSWTTCINRRLRPRFVAEKATAKVSELVQNSSFSSLCNVANET